MEAARQLAAFPLGQIDEVQQKVLQKVFDEYEAVLRFTAERPESQLNLGLFYTNRKMPKKALKAYEEALHLQSQFIPAYINYSNFLMMQGKNKEAFEILQKGIKNAPAVGILHHALGLWYIRNKESAKAIEALKKAVKLAPDNARFAYVYAISIGTKEPKKAIEILEKAYAKHNGDLQIVSALAYYYKQIGNSKMSKEYEQKLKSLQNFSVR